MKNNEEPCCNARLRKQWMKEDPNVTAVYFDLSNIERMNNRGNKKTGQRLEIYRNITMKKSGEIRNKKFNTFVAHEFCPFCGKKYEV